MQFRLVRMSPLRQTIRWMLKGMFCLLIILICANAEADEYYPADNDAEYKPIAPSDDNDGNYVPRVLRKKHAVPAVKKNHEYPVDNDAEYKPERQPYGNDVDQQPPIPPFPSDNDTEYKPPRPKGVDGDKSFYPLYY